MEMSLGAAEPHASAHIRIRDHRGKFAKQAKVHLLPGIHIKLGTRSLYRLKPMVSVRSTHTTTRSWPGWPKRRMVALRQPLALSGVRLAGCAPLP